MTVTQNLPLQKYMYFTGETQYKVNKLLIDKTLRDNCASNIWLKLDKNSSSQGLGYIAINFWWRTQKTGLENELLGNSKTALEDPQGRDRSGASVDSRDRGAAHRRVSKEWTNWAKWVSHRTGATLPTMGGCY